MRNRLRKPLLAMAGALVVSSVLSAQSPGMKDLANPSAPDFSGVWQGPTQGQFKRTDMFPEEKGRGFAFTAEQPPMQPWAEQKYKANHAPDDQPNDHGRTELDPGMRCFPPGPTWLLTQPRPFEIFQVPGRMLIVYEWDHWVRPIWTDGRGHLKDADPTWMGHSIGKWDGDTLIVDTVGLNDKTWLDMAGHVHTEDLHVVERWRRTKPDTLVVDIVFDDPKAYTKPWKGQKVFKLHPDWEVQEHVGCEDHLLHEHGPL